jgi:integrase
MNLSKKTEMSVEDRKMRMTEATIRKLICPEDKPRVTFKDKGTRGLELRVSRSGLKTWTYQYKPRGEDKSTRLTLGSWPELSADGARQKAAELTYGRRHEGRDPRIEVYRPKTATIVNEILNAYEAYLEKHCKPKTLLDYRQQMKAFRKTFGNTVVTMGAVKGFMGGDLTRWLAQHRTGKGSARATVKMIRQAWNHSMKEEVGILPKGTYNPGSCLIRETPWLQGKGKTHARALEDSEMIALLAALDEAKAISRGEAPLRAGVPPLQLSGVLLIELLMITGARRGELQTLEWDHIKGDKIVRIEHKMSGETAEPRIILLPEDAIKVINEAKEYCKHVGYEGPFVFPTNGHRAKQEYICRPDHYAKWIGIMAGFKDKLKCHNLRSIYINYHKHSGVDLSIVANNVGHSSVKTTEQHYVENPTSIRREGIRVGADYRERMRAKIIAKAAAAT